MVLLSAITHDRLFPYSANADPGPYRLVLDILPADTG